jgi:glycine/D-amino acid oxidase-like deaminating enzyme
MQEKADRSHEELRDGCAPWHTDGRPGRQVLHQDRRCDVVVVGAGITGALIAENLTAQGRKVCIVDRERPGLGSTAASTAMLLWEIDTPLKSLAELYGFERAGTIYQRSRQAVSGLTNLVRSRRLRCALRRRQSLYLSAGETGERELLAEHELRRRAGLPGDYLDYRTLRQEFGFDRQAALLSPGAADLDPLCLAHELTNLAISRGAQLFDGDAVSFDSSSHGAAVGLDNGHAIEADWVVLATGYVMPDLVKSDLHRISSTWALATPPQPAPNRWHGGLLLWEATQSYLYARTTVQHRLIVGGEDDATATPAERDAATPAKTAALLRRLATLFPQAEAVAERTWSGAFGTTADGLPLIGAVPGHPRLLAAYGYGGNGITFGFMASRMIAGLIAGRQARWFDDFRLDRPRPRALPETITP